MRQWLIDLLKALEARVPPHTGGHHAITYNQYGSDAQGWEDRLGLHVGIANRNNMTFFLDDGDFEKTVEAVVDEIAQHIATELGKAAERKGPYLLG